jgi:hypothetical protein
MVLPLLAAGAAMGLASGIGQAVASSNRRRTKPIEYGDEAFRSQLRAQAMGQGPSLAALQARYQGDEARNAAMSIAASGSGAQVGAARLAAQQGNAAAQAGIGQAAALGRIEERRAGQAMYGAEMGALYGAQADQERMLQQEAWMRAQQRRQNVAGIFQGVQGGMAAAASLPAGGAAGGGMAQAAPMYAQQDPTSSVYQAWGPPKPKRPIDEIASMYGQ